MAVFPDTLNSGPPLYVLDMAARSFDLHHEIELQVSTGKFQQAKSQQAKSQ
jgi:hypothetical protein